MDWNEALKTFGLPGAMLGALAFMLWKGLLYSSREVDAMLKQMAELKTEKDMWRDMALRSADLGDRAARAAEKLADTNLPAKSESR